MKLFVLTVLLVLATISASAYMPPMQSISNDPPATDDSTLGNFTVGDGVDYATRVLGDAWDMSEFTDISQGLNTLTNPDQHLTNIQVAGGIFSASNQGIPSFFLPLFPGYPPGTHSGKIGALYPINSSVFSCLSIAMKSISQNQDYLTIAWAANDDINNPAGTGQSYYLKNNQWMVVQIDLKNPRNQAGAPWSSQNWQYLRITPSIYAGAQFKIDWIRLTDCTKTVNVPLDGIQTGYSLWINTGVTDGPVLVKDSFTTSGSYAWDVQGLAAGSYTYYVKDAGGITKQQGQVNIVETPIVTFTSPSEYSGQDYANSQGNPWDMNDRSDAPYINCVNYADFSNGILTISTGSSQCIGPGASEADPKIFLNTPDHGNLSSYRYLSFSSSTTGYPWSVPQLGMIVRLFWSLDRPSGADCWYGSRAVALDVGWQTYTVDLYDGWNGLPEEKTPSDCPNVSWRDQASVGPVVAFRIDPNENITGSDMQQQFDWIRITKVQKVTLGAPAKIRVLLNRPPSDVNLTYYYTTDLSQPTQHLANPSALTTSAGQSKVFLPLIVKSDPFYDPFVNQLPADVTFSWDTRGVAQGEYYICAAAADAYNQAIYCSHAPIQVYP